MHKLHPRRWNVGETADFRLTFGYVVSRPLVPRCGECKTVGCWLDFCGCDCHIVPGEDIPSKA